MILVQVASRDRSGCATTDRLWIETIPGMTAYPPPIRMSANYPTESNGIPKRGKFVANRDSSLRFAVYNSLGEMAPLRPYMGMLGHCVVRRNDGSVFAHLHPTGTISMAMEEKLNAQENTRPFADTAADRTGSDFPLCISRCLANTGCGRKSAPAAACSLEFLT